MTVVNRPAAIFSVLLACLLIAAGRFFVRRARRAPQPGPRIRGRALGWAFLFAGLLAMIFGAVLW